MRQIPTWLSLLVIAAVCVLMWWLSVTYGVR